MQASNVARFLLHGSLIVCGLNIAGCGRPASAADDILLEPDLVYGQVGDVKLQLDLARPKGGDGPFPAIVLIHGGGWAGGNRHSFRPYLEEAARKGYVAVTISYRLTQYDPKTMLGKVPHPAQIHDCKCAVRWLRSVANKYRINPDRIGVCGGSAGGHLSLLVGLADKDAGLEGDGGHAEQSSRVQAVVNIYGPTDMAQLYVDSPDARTVIAALCNGTPDTAPEVYKAVSPITYVSADDPPVLTLHGDKDTLVPDSQAKLLDAAMTKAGAQHIMLILKDQGHGFTGPEALRANESLWKFFARHLNAK